MSLTDAFVGVLFKQDERGRTLFFPNGVLGRGYIVPDAETEARLRKTMTWLQFGAVGIGIGGMLMAQAFAGPLSGWPAGMWAGFGAVTLVLMVLMRVAVKRLVTGLRPGPDKSRLSLTEFYARQAVALPRWYHWMQVLFSGLFFVTSLGLLIFNEEMTGVALLGVSLFGAITAYSIYGLHAGSAARMQ